MRGFIRLTWLTVSVFAMLSFGVAGATEVPGSVNLPIRIGVAPAASSVMVQSGDHLWLISKRHLETVLQREARDSEVSPYWREVIEVNTPNLRSGDPDLIYPGEIVTLPSLSGQRTAVNR